jgi:hypothetical protein
MGITIHYSGQLKAAKLLPTLIEELEDIAKIYNWSTHSFNTKYENDVFKTEDNNEDYGMVIKVPECEPIVFIFDHAGYLYSPWLKQYFTERMYTHNISTKTQFAGADIHTKIIGLLKYLDKKYLDNLTVIDEGEYWQTGNKKLLDEKIDFLKDKINTLTDFINNGEMLDGESLEDFITRIAKGIHKEK